MSDYFLFFFLGAVAGHGLTLLWLAFEAAKRLTVKEKVVNPSGYTTTVSERMKRIKDITSEQLELTRQVDGPQKNGLDGRHKNGMIGKIKRLDEEKNDILKSILLDGHDPEITTMDNTGVVTQMKLSEYMVMMGIKMEPKKSTKPAASRVGKFTVLKGGKDDGGKTTH